SGVLLAVARAAGETAPLLFTIGAATQTNWNPFHGPNTALSVQIFSNASLPFQAAKDRAWGAALTLITMTFVLLVVARLIARRFDKRRRSGCQCRRKPRTLLCLRGRPRADDPRPAATRRRPPRPRPLGRRGEGGRRARDAKPHRLRGARARGLL